MEVLSLKIRPEEVSKIIKTEIENYKNSLDIASVGTVVEIGDGIARVYGLQNAMAGELLEFWRHWRYFYPQANRWPPGTIRRRVTSSAPLQIIQIWRQ